VVWSSCGGSWPPILGRTAGAARRSRDGEPAGRRGLAARGGRLPPPLAWSAAQVRCQTPSRRARAWLIMLVASHRGCLHEYLLSLPPSLSPPYPPIRATTRHGAPDARRARACRAPPDPARRGSAALPRPSRSRACGARASRRGPAAGRCRGRLARRLWTVPAAVVVDLL